MPYESDKLPNANRYIIAVCLGAILLGCMALAMCSCVSTSAAVVNDNGIGPAGIAEKIHARAVVIRGKVRQVLFGRIKSHFSVPPPLVRHGAQAFERKSTAWPATGAALNQEREGSCIGHGNGQSVNHSHAAGCAASPPVTHEYCRQVYFEAQRNDDWPGGAYPGARPFYEGSTLKAGVEAMRSFGWTEGAQWAFTVDDIAYGIQTIGPAVVASQWHESMSQPDKDGWITVSGKSVGGHCYCIEAVTYDVAADGGGYLTILNSWGPEWGIAGRAKISFAEAAKIWKGTDKYGNPVDGEAAFLRPRTTPQDWDGSAPVSPAVPWWKWIFGAGKAVAK